MEKSKYQNPPHWIIESKREKFQKMRDVAEREFKYSLHCPRKERPLEWTELEWREYLVHWGYLIGSNGHAKKYI
jgi:hypothetical protein